MRKKRVWKQATALALALSLSAASYSTAFASEDTKRLKLFGQEIQLFSDFVSESWEDKIYVAIIEGVDEINIDNFTPVDSSQTIQTTLGDFLYNALKDRSFEIHEAAPADIITLNNNELDTNNYHFLQYFYNDSTNADTDFAASSHIYVFKLPAGYTVESLGDLGKYVIYANGTSNVTSEAEGWQKDSNGWWYRNADGSYPVSTWKEIYGKQYYFDGNGYMLHDTTTPDGYLVGSDGAWVQ